MLQIRGSESSEVAMKNDPADVDQIDEALMPCDLADEALEAAARVDGGTAITVGYCATASNAWYCMPL
jgi:dienelactone hydrolase